MSDNIPFDIEFEIIKRLPIKSLIQFRSVSKTWMSLIESSQFIAKYQQNTRLQKHLLVGDAYEDKYVSFVDNDTFPHQKAFLTPPKSVLNLNNPPIGCSQGLFCFDNLSTEKTAIIWNPTIRKSVDVVVPMALDGRSYSTVIGFGVCPRTLDPMLVKISTETGCLDEKLTDTTWVVEVFRLSSGVWKSLCVDMPRSIVVQYNQVVIDKFIYWPAFEQMSGYALIICFNMIAEEFTEIRLPDSLLVDTDMKLFICKLKESLVVLQFDETDFCPDFGIWLMENGDIKSFKKIYTIKFNIPDTQIERILEFNRNGEPLVEMTKVLDNEEEEEHEIFVYEPNSQHVNHLGISAKGSWFFASSYTGTLLLLDH